MKQLFLDDYSEGTHPEILDALSKANTGQQVGYGLDDYSKLAADRIRAVLNTDADVHFVVGGTQANLICLASMLKPYEAVVATRNAHISVHEAGAIEATGHKIVEVESVAGKLTPEEIKRVAATHQDEHMVAPKVVFISQATETGTIYSKDELEAIVNISHELGLYVYLDGARLAIAMTAPSNDLDLSDLARLGIDIFYLGGTKNGAFCGEAIVVVNPDLRDGFRRCIKQHGGLLAKGRLLGIQFARFFDTDQLWLELGKEANDNAVYLADKLKEINVPFAEEPTTNQLFINLPNRAINSLKEVYDFHIWNPVDQDSSKIRLVASWATPKEVIDKFVEDLGLLLQG